MSIKDDRACMSESEIEDEAWGYVAYQRLYDNDYEAFHEAYLRASGASIAAFGASMWESAKATGVI